MFTLIAIVIAASMTTAVIHSNQSTAMQAGKMMTCVLSDVVSSSGSRMHYKNYLTSVDQSQAKMTFKEFGNAIGHEVRSGTLCPVDEEFVTEKLAAVKDLDNIILYATEDYIKNQLISRIPMYEEVKHGYIMYGTFKVMISQDSISPELKEIKKATSYRDDYNTSYLNYGFKSITTDRSIGRLDTNKIFRSHGSKANYLKKLKRDAKAFGVSEYDLEIYTHWK